MESIRDAWGFSGKTPIIPSRGFSVETLTGVTLSWKTELNISTVEDGISRGLQHHHKTCCEKGGHCGRRACIVWRWFHHGDIISRQVDLHMIYDWCLMYLARTRIESNDKIISCAIVISVSTLYSRHCFIALFSWLYDSWTHV